MKTETTVEITKHEEGMYEIWVSRAGKSRGRHLDCRRSPADDRKDIIYRNIEEVCAKLETDIQEEE